MAALTAEMTAAVRDRALCYVWQMPDVKAQFDNGVNCGEVIVLGPLPGEPRCARVRVPGREEIFAVRLNSLSVSEETAAHLATARAAMTAGPITGHYSASNSRHCNSRGGYRR